MYTQRFDDALVFASTAHRAQRRKGVDVPYITHLLAVTALVGEAGGSEDQVIAALLHDAIEDCIVARPNIEQEISDAFGAAVLEIVQGCTDTWIHPKPPWRDRKVAYLERLRAKSADSPVMLVSLADKLHNSRSILMDHRQVGDQIFERFRGKKDGTLWYYQALNTIFQEKFPDDRLAKEFDQVVGKLGVLV